MFTKTIFRCRVASLLASVITTGALVCGTANVARAETVPLPAGANSAASTSLQAVSCPAAGSCSAAGDYLDSAGKQELLLLDQNGGAWKATEGDLSGLIASSGGVDANHYGLWPESISCVSAANCTVTGYYRDAADDDEPLLITESAGSWGKATTVALPPGAMAGYGPEVPSVSCWSPGNCTAIGSYQDGSGYDRAMTLAQTNGTWAPAVQSPLPAGAAANPTVTVSSVACTSVGNCVANGTYNTAGGSTEGLLLTEANGSWSAAAVSLSGLSIASQATHSVSIEDANGDGADSTLVCPAAGSCAAVADYLDTHGASEGMLLSQSGGVWSAHTLNLSQLSDPEYTLSGNPDPHVSLASVSCASAGNCSASGQYEDHLQDYAGFVVDEISGAWQPASTVPLPSNAFNGNTGIQPSWIACSAAGNCDTGFLYDSNSNPVTVESLIDTSSGTTWTTNDVTIPGSDTVTPDYDWISAACAPTGYCTSLETYVYDTHNDENVLSLSAPSAPAAVTATAGSDQAVASWTAPGDSGGLAVSGYNVVATDLTNPASGGQVMSVGGTTLNATFTGLTPGNSYAFTVTPSNALGTGVSATSAGATVLASPAQLAATLGGVLKPVSKAGRLKAIRKARGYTFTYGALESGQLTIDWYRITRVRKHEHRTLVAAGQTQVSAGSAKLTVRLTRSGRALIKHDRRLKLTAYATFTPAGQTPVTLKATFTLH